MGGSKLLVYVRIVVAAIFVFITEEDWVVARTKEGNGGGEGGEKISSLSPPPPPPLFSRAKTFMRLKKTPALQANHFYKKLFRLRWKNLDSSTPVFTDGVKMKKGVHEP